MLDLVLQNSAATALSIFNDPTFSFDLSLSSNHAGALISLLSSDTTPSPSYILSRFKVDDDLSTTWIDLFHLHPHMPLFPTSLVDDVS